MLAKNIERVPSFRVEVDPAESVNASGGKKMANNCDLVVEGRALSSGIQRINERLNDAVESVAKTPTNQLRNRSPDLVPLTADYLRMKNDLRALLEVLLSYQKCTRELHETRFKVIEKLASFSEGSPIQEVVERELDGETTDKLHLLSQNVSSSQSSLSTTSFSPSVSTSKASSSMSFFLQSMGIVKEDDFQPSLVAQISEDYRNRNGASALSLKGVYCLGAAQAVGNDTEYHAHVLEYTTEWMDTVTKRVDEGLKIVKKLAAERLHYERKIETLRDKANDLERKGKTSPSSAVERLSRNETKLRESFFTHEKEAGKLCALIETVTREGYKDLYILVRNYIQWELNRIGSESDLSFQLKATLNFLNEKFRRTAQMTWEPWQ